MPRSCSGPRLTVAPGCSASRVLRGMVGMAVHEPPLAVDPPQDVGDAQGHGRGRATVDADLYLFVTDGVGEVAAPVDDLVARTAPDAVGEPRRDPVEGG